MFENLKKSIWKSVCNHPSDRLLRVRVHKDSKIGIEHAGKALCADRYGCLVLLQCTRCGEFFAVEHDDLCTGLKMVLIDLENKQ